MDCDTSFNHGCNGGNSARAYEYILHEGLHSATTWPFKGHQEACPIPISSSSSDTTSSPERVGAVAGINSFVVLPSRNEAWMRQYVGSVGPVSVGVCGTDLRFMFYGGGIFNPDDCCTTLNHAMLIVGYGECVCVLFICVCMCMVYVCSSPLIHPLLVCSLPIVLTLSPIPFFTCPLHNFFFLCVFVQLIDGLS